MERGNLPSGYNRPDRPDRWRQEPLPLHQLAATYLNEQLTAEARLGIEQVQANANPALRATPAEVVTAIPVGPYESADTLWHTLALSARQLRRAPPSFWVVLSINGTEASGLADVREVVREAHAYMPRLPLSFAEIIYDEPRTIGGIKKDTADMAWGALTDHHRGHLPLRAALHNQDADPVRYSPGHMRRLYEPIRHGVTVTQARERHGRSGGRFPNMDEVIFWYDLIAACNPLAMHDKQNMIAADGYFAANGYDATLDMKEGIHLQRRMSRIFPEYRRVIPSGVFGVTSPRRPYAYLQEGIPPTHMWGESFSVREAYRSLDPDFSSLHDISPEDAKTFIMELLREGGDLQLVTQDIQVKLLRSHLAGTQAGWWSELRFPGPGVPKHRTLQEETDIALEVSRRTRNLKEAGRFVVSIGQQRDRLKMLEAELTHQDDLLTD